MSWGDVKPSSLLDAGDYIRKRELGAQQDMPHVSVLDIMSITALVTSQVPPIFYLCSESLPFSSPHIPSLSAFQLLPFSFTFKVMQIRPPEIKLSSNTHSILSTTFLFPS